MNKSIYIKVWLVIIIIATINTDLISQSINTSDYDKNRVKPILENPRYWQYKAEPTLLIGGSSNDNIFQNVDFESELKLISSFGGNYIRNTMSERDSGNVSCFLKINDKYDLNSFNPEYWEKFEKLLKLAYELDIIVQIEVWEFHDYNLGYWSKSPWNPKNNINYTTENCKLNVEGVRLQESKHPFFFSLPKLNNDELLLSYQEKFVDQLLSKTLLYPNILYCITNEIHPQYSPEWGWYWSDFIRNKAKQLGKEVEITEMFWEPDFKSEQQKDSFNRNDKYSYFEASQNSARSSVINWLNSQYINKQINLKPRPVNAVKIYGSDEGPNWAGSSYEGKMRFWRNIFAGFASSRFHRPPFGIGSSQVALNNIKAVRLLQENFNIFISKTDFNYENVLDMDNSEIFVLKNSSNNFALFFGKGGKVKLISPYKQLTSCRITSISPNTLEISTNNYEIKNNLINIEISENEMKILIVEFNLNN